METATQSPKTWLSEHRCTDTRYQGCIWSQHPCASKTELSVLLPVLLFCSGIQSFKSYSPSSPGEGAWALVSSVWTEYLLSNKCASLVCATHTHTNITHSVRSLPGSIWSSQKTFLSPFGAISADDLLLVHCCMWLTLRWTRLWKCCVWWR